jgi:hypothetical protein
MILDFTYQANSDKKNNEEFLTAKAQKAKKYKNLYLSFFALFDFAVYILKFSSPNLELLPFQQVLLKLPSPRDILSRI